MDGHTAGCLSLRILQLPADSALRAAAWRVALADSAVMHLQAGRCEFAHPVSTGERERLRRVLSPYDVMEAAGET